MFDRCVSTMYRTRLLRHRVQHCGISHTTNNILDVCYGFWTFMVSIRHPSKKALLLVVLWMSNGCSYGSRFQTGCIFFLISIGLSNERLFFCSDFSVSQSNGNTQQRQLLFLLFIHSSMSLFKIALSYLCFCPASQSKSCITTKVKHKHRK
jgi:hypothetical protein